MPDDAVLERTAAFDPASLSAREARRFVRQMLMEAGREEWAEPAELAVSELVTNVVLHAHTPFELTVRLSDDHVRIEIRDHNPALPRQRSYSAEATTGRGMALVEAVTDAHGVSSFGPDGKVVWFCVGGRPAELSADDLLDSWDDTGWEVEAGEPAPGPPADGQLTEVTFRNMPPTLWLAARQHHDALLRELTLYLAEHDDCAVGLDDLTRADAARTTISAALDTTVARARLHGQKRLPLADDVASPLPELPATLDLRVPVPPGSGASFAVLQDVLDTAERLALSEALLVTPGLPEVVAVRDWACEQVISQLAGGDPAPWPGAESDRFVHQVNDGGAPLQGGWDARTVTESDLWAVAGDDANRIVAVSRPFAEASGYAVDELVGRRVTSLVPPRLREAHVAGFTRYLSTGEAHVLGVSLELPVLRRDGTELPCTFLIEELGTSSGRRVFVAWITPRG